jgi:hypothetical protein
MKPVSILATLLAALFAVFPACADLNLVDVLQGQIENFPKNMHGTWANRQGKVELSDKSIDGKIVMVLNYRMDQPKQDGGAWFGLAHSDLRGYDAIEIKVRGAAGGEMLAVGFKDDRWFETKLPLDRYLKGGITKEWQTVRVPLTDFDRLRMRHSLDNWSLSFSNLMDGAKSGEIYISDVKLIGEGKQLPPPVEQKDRYPMAFDPEKATDEQLYDLIQKSAFEFFWKEANPKNGLIKDSCYAFGDDGMQGASIASVGFGLSAICVAEKRGWITHDQAYERVLNTLKFFRDEAEQHKGFYYHFYEMDTGFRSGDCELSSIDTGLFLYGVITVKEFYKGTEVAKAAQTILDRVEWDWMQLNKGVLSMGWKPEKPEALFEWTWGGYNEGMMLYPLAIGSKTHPIPAKIWDLVDREASMYNKRKHVAGTGDNALFTHQYPQCWLDLRKVKDKKGINYFENSVQATWANYEWCKENAQKFKTFREGYWGLTASDGPDGYNVDGAPFSKSNGTVAPTAALGSFPFTPKLSMDAAKSFFKLKETLWGRYGFVDGFNLDRDWSSFKYIGIDQGPIVMMIENLRTGLLWELTMRDESVQRGLKEMGFSAPAEAVETPPEARQTSSPSK